MNLIKTALQLRELAQTRDRPSNSHLHRDALTDLSHKTDLITQLWERGEPITLLNIGQSIPLVQYDPIWKLALQSPTPQRLMEGWIRFEKYGHSNNRVQIKLTSENVMTCQRYSLFPPNPSRMENHLICGILAALLSHIGCENLVCTTKDPEGTRRTIYKNHQFKSIVNKIDFRFSEWTFKWTDHHLKTPIPSSFQKITLPPSPRSGSDAGRRILHRASAIVLSDITKSWKVSEIAAELNLSQRSLQRRLTEAGVTFSALIRILRISAASELLKDTDMSINVIGFCTGFSDNSHFSRDFRASMGMPPTEYQTACRTTGTKP